MIVFRLYQQRLPLLISLGSSGIECRIEEGGAEEEEDGEMALQVHEVSVQRRNRSSHLANVGIHDLARLRRGAMLQIKSLRKHLSAKAIAAHRRLRGEICGLFSIGVAFPKESYVPKWA